MYKIWVFLWRMGRGKSKVLFLQYYPNLQVGNTRAVVVDVSRLLSLIFSCIPISGSCLSISTINGRWSHWSATLLRTLYLFIFCFSSRRIKNSSQLHSYIFKMLIWNSCLSIVSTWAGFLRFSFHFFVLFIVWDLHLFFPTCFTSVMQYFHLICTSFVAFL